MVPERYADLGFEITKFGINSKVLKFNKKPIFVFSANMNTDAKFLTSICDTYLKISEKRNNLSCIRSN